MFHFCVGKTSGKTSVLHVDFDCIILDAWSAKLLLNEIFSLYYGKDVKFPRISFMNYMRLKTDSLSKVSSPLKDEGGTIEDEVIVRVVKWLKKNVE